MKKTVLIYVIDASHTKLLLAEKLRGFGTGKLNGAGGHLEEGESPLEGAVRELREEFCLHTKPEDLKKVAEQTFHFNHLPSWQNITFVTDTWTGEPRPSDDFEMGQPSWFDFNALPFDRMWSDDILWLPKVLEGTYVEAEFWFEPNNETIRKHKVRTPAL